MLRAGGVPRLVRLTPPDWRISEEKLAEAFTPDTRFVLFNNPHNPTARAFDRDELEILASFCVRHDAIAICDEVWEHVQFDGRVHIPLATLDGMAERTVKIGSAGKIFSLTGWKVGWVAAAPPLAAAVARAHQFVTFATATNLQNAVAYGLGKSDDYYAAMRAGFAASRDAMRAALGKRAMPCSTPRGLILRPPRRVGDALDAAFSARGLGMRRRHPDLGLLRRRSWTNVTACVSPSGRNAETGVAALARARALLQNYLEPLKLDCRKAVS